MRAAIERSARCLVNGATGIDAGVNDFITKPIGVTDVALRVGNAVYSKRLFDRVQDKH